MFSPYTAQCAAYFAVSLCLFAAHCAKVSLYHIKMNNALFGMTEILSNNSKVDNSTLMHIG